jgi:tricarballylate dehydrogenase
MNVKKKRDCDILVVGGGNAGLVASIGAKNAGANVLLMEKAPKKARGGNSRLSGGLFRVASEGNKDYLPLLEEGSLPKGEVYFEPYLKDDFYNKVMRLSEGWADKRFTEIFVEKSLDTARWMKAQGVRWEVNPNFSYSGREGDRIVFPSGIAPLQAVGAGEGLVEMEYGIVEKLGIEVLYETAARSLIVNEDGKVCGVLCKGPEGFIEIETRNVILACGGFQANPAWRRRYLGENWDLVKLRGTRYDTGDGIQMAVGIGAQVAGHWGGCHASIVSEDSPMIEAASAGSERYSYQLSIMVNRNGERFIDEGEDFVSFTYAKFGKEISKQPGAVAYQIFDSKLFPMMRAEYQTALRVEAQTLEEVAEELDLPVEAFLATVRKFNDAIVDKPFLIHRLDGRRTRGLNPDKTNWAQRIDTPPYRAYAVVCGLTMTYGGLKTNEKAQVIDTSDRTFNGLYAVGEVTGGFFYHNYPSGTGLVRGAVMGRIAASEAVANL